MQTAPLPGNESVRLQTLRALDILDTQGEALYDDVTELASRICETPVSLVSLIDADRQWFKSKQGVSASETPRDIAFCAHAILGDGIFEIEDSTKDMRFHDNPLVTGASKVVFYAGVPLDMGDGVKVGTLCVIDDKPKRLTEGQRSALKCLANQVVAHLCLRRSNRELEKALKAKSAFFANMSHEIRTPMNGILGITNLLIDSTRDEGTRQQLELVRSCSDILLTLLNDILDFSKIESGMAVFENHPFSLPLLIQNTLEVLSGFAKTKNLSLRCDLGEAPEWVGGDSTRLSQILMNLIGNALKFTASGEVSLTLESRIGRTGGAEITFTVRDQGIGIPAEVQEKLFKPFTQVDASTTRKYGGTGLGLAIVRGLVEGMGGRLKLVSAPGEGSAFSFTLEFAQAHAPARATPIADPPRALPGSRAPTVLVAEDNRVNQIVALKLLEKLGYKADLACNGAEVLSMLETKRYDVIFMDCQMPEMDGFEATERILRIHPAGKRPAIFALTAAVTEEEEARCLAIGMSKILRKPVTLEALRDVLRDFPAA